jgi:hypothetical protein
MRLTLLTPLLVLAAGTAAFSQPASRFEIGPVVRLDKVSMEGGASGSTTVAGVVTTFKISKTYGVEVEVHRRRIGLTEATKAGSFPMSRAGRRREEIERLAPIVRRSLGVMPGVGWSTAFVLEATSTGASA